MRTKNTEAFALRSYPLRENDKIVNLFTKDYGKIRGVARGARKMKNRFGSCFEPFTRLEVEFHRKKEVELVNINNATIIRSPYRLETLLDLSWHLAYMGEIVDTISPEWEPEPVYFRLLTKLFDAVEGKGNIATLTRYFEVWTLKLHGVFPETEHCVECRRELGERRVSYSGEARGFLCPSCSKRAGSEVLQEIKEGELPLLRRIRSESPSEMGSSFVPPEINRRLMKLTYSMIREFAGREIRSYRFIEELSRMD